ncbi:MAG TPA: hypothetical protein VNE58_04635 [Casimicrobiaceae bacterium]|nr:hypothetical protein [Casimicrobiaceae bacterium]
MARRAARSTEKFEIRRAERRAGLGADGAYRATIAQTAARLIAEHGITDWSAAKRKAARQLDLPERSALPGDDEIQEALRDYHALFAGEEHEAMLREQREEALLWMKRLAQFRPRLVGGVAEGWATEHSDIRLELAADDDKAVEMALLNGRVAYRSLPLRNGEPSSELVIETRRGVVRLIVLTHSAARHRPRRDRHGQQEVRLDAARVEALLNTPQSARNDEA